MKMNPSRWWLLLFGVIVAWAVVVSDVVHRPSPVNHSSGEVTQRAASETASKDCFDASASDAACQQHRQREPRQHEPTREVAKRTTEAATTDCSGDPSTDFACLQERYQGLVYSLGVEAAFAELKNELPRNELVRSNCHELTHIIGHAAADLYGDIATTYSRGDSFCGSGYYHGAMEAIVANIGAEKVLEEVDTLCAGLYSFYHYNCAHGLGHGFMRVQDNELFKALDMCDALSDRWERNRCYGGVFMENVVDEDHPVHPSKFLKADQPLYPCDAVKFRYKNECYQRQTSYALQLLSNDFTKVFDLCERVENRFRPACYQGLGWDASVQSLKQGNSDATINESTSMICMLGDNHEARSNCVVGAVDYFIRNSYNDVQARAFCGYLGVDLRTLCLQEAEAYYRTLQPPSERRGTVS
jgi:hypothetical protein